jgi:hypothetical protein
MRSPDCRTGRRGFSWSALADAFCNDLSAVLNFWTKIDRYQSLLQAQTALRALAPDDRQLLLKTLRSSAGFIGPFTIERVSSGMPVVNRLQHRGLALLNERTRMCVNEVEAGDLR